MIFVLILWDFHSTFRTYSPSLLQLFPWWPSTFPSLPAQLWDFFFPLSSPVCVAQLVLGVGPALLCDWHKKKKTKTASSCPSSYPGTSSLAVVGFCAHLTSSVLGFYLVTFYLQPRRGVWECWYPAGILWVQPIEQCYLFWGRVFLLQLIHPGDSPMSMPRGLLLWRF